LNELKQLLLSIRISAEMENFLVCVWSRFDSVVGKKIARFHDVAGCHEFETQPGPSPTVSFDKETDSKLSFTALRSGPMHYLMNFKVNMGFHLVKNK